MNEGRKSQNGDSGLRVWTDDTESYVAYSADDAKKAQREFIGENPEEDTCWEMVEPSTEMRIYDENEGRSGSIVAMTAAQWCEKNGRGFLCSTEF